MKNIVAILVFFNHSEIIILNYKLRKFPQDKMTITKKEYKEMDMDDHVVAQAILHELEIHKCLSKKGKEFKKMYYKELDDNIGLDGKPNSYLNDEFKKVNHEHQMYS